MPTTVTVTLTFPDERPEGARAITPDHPDILGPTLRTIASAVQGGHGDGRRAGPWEAAWSVDDRSPSTCRDVLTGLDDDRATRLRQLAVSLYGTRVPLGDIAAVEVDLNLADPTVVICHVRGHRRTYRPDLGYPLNAIKEIIDA